MADLPEPLFAEALPLAPQPQASSPPLEAALFTPEFISRFWSRVDRHSHPGGCWEWQGGLNSGYGKVWVNREHPDAYTHIVSYLLAGGSILPGLELDHLCRNRRCCNPAHLEPVTHRENVLRSDGAAARHARVTICPRGHHYTGANLRIRTSGRRACRECERERDRARGRRRGKR